MIVGPLPVFFHLKKEAREFAEAVVFRAHADELIRISDAEKLPGFKWENDGREFSINGHMYDVARIEVVNGHISYVCFDDERETKLNDEIAGVISTQFDHPASQHGKTVMHLLQLVLQPFIADAGYVWNGRVVDMNRKHQYCCSATRMSWCILEHLTPPPRCNA